eukprot:scaffold1381_cov386-Prasinococcus_capsulatus_cf.AAC.1
MTQVVDRAIESVRESANTLGAMDVKLKNPPEVEVIDAWAVDGLSNQLLADTDVLQTLKCAYASSVNMSCAYVRAQATSSERRRLLKDYTVLSFFWTMTEEVFSDIELLLDSLNNVANVEAALTSSLVTEMVDERSFGVASTKLSRISEVRANMHLVVATSLDVNIPDAEVEAAMVKSSPLIKEHLGTLEVVYGDVAIHNRVVAPERDVRDVGSENSAQGIIIGTTCAAAALLLATAVFMRHGRRRVGTSHTQRKALVLRPTDRPSAPPYQEKAETSPAVVEAVFPAPVATAPYLPTEVSLAMQLQWIDAPLGETIIAKLCAHGIRNTSDLVRLSEEDMENMDITAPERASIRAIQRLFARTT